MSATNVDRAGDPASAVLDAGDRDPAGASWDYEALSRALAPPRGTADGFEEAGVAPADVASVEAEHVGLFGRAGPARLSPYAGEHRGTDPYSVVGAYADAGLAPDPSFRDRPDHVSAELACLAALARDEERARACGDPAAVQRTTASRRDFFTRHVGPWLPQFFESMAAASGFPLHQRLAAAGAAALAAEARESGVPAVPSAPPPLPAEGTCSVCAGGLGYVPPEGAVPLPSWGLVCIRCRVRRDLRRTWS